MFYYIFVFSLTTILGFVFDSIIAENHTINKVKIQRNWSLLVLSTIFIVFVGFRAYSVGADTEVYVMKLEDAATMTLGDYLASRLYLEPVFNSLIWLCGNLTTYHTLFFLICAVFYFNVLVLFSVENSKSVGWSVWLINSLGFLTLALSTVRQSMAIACCLLAYLNLEKNSKKSWFYYLLAIGTHVSSIVFLPMMFVRYFSKKYSVFLMVVLVGLSSFLGPMIMGDLSMAYATLTDKVSYEEAAENVGGIGMILFLSLLLVFGLLSYFPLKEKNIPPSYYNEFVAIGLALTIFIVSRFNLGTMRLYWYYLVFAIVYVPNVIGKMNKSYKYIAYILVFAISFYYLFAKVMDSPYEDSRLLLPYSFIWD